MTRILVLLFFVIVTNPVLAQENKLKPLPDIASLDIQTFVSQSDKIHKNFSDDKFIEFDVQLPKTFVEQNIASLKSKIDDGRLYGELFRANGTIIEDVYPYFSLKSYKLNRDISAKNWLVIKTLNEGQTLRSIEVSDDKNSLEAMVVRFDALGNTEIVRLKAFLKGPRMIVAEYVLPVLLWNERMDYQTYAIKSFELGGSNDDATIEMMKSYAHLNSFSMRYPDSWVMRTRVRNEDNRIDLSFKSADDLRVIFAHIDVSVVSTKSLRDTVDRSIYPTHIPSIINERKGNVLAQGFLIGDVMERLSFDLGIESQLQVTEVYPLRKKLTDYVTHREAPISHEFWITAIKGTEESGKSYIVSMMVPSRQDNLDNWALATKAYQEMIESIR